jgi:hypothetical protein
VPPGLWSTTIPTPHQANASFTAPRKTAAIQHLHASLFSPNTQTWIKAINNRHLKLWPTFTTQDIKKYLPKSVATTLGHLDQQRKNLRSTKNKPKKSNTEDAAGIEYSNPAQESTTSLGFANIIEINDPKHKSYSDLTGRFPIHSSHGNLYVLVFYLYDANAILVEPLKNWTEGEQLRAYQHILQRIPSHHKPRMHWMDNEASAALKGMLVNDFQMEYQLVPPHIHRRNVAERATHMFKNHFIAGLCSTNPDFPLRLWDSRLPQAEITLNLLRAAQTNPNASAYETLFGNFDYNKTPLMPPGVKVIVHKKPHQRGTWEPHGKLGWYLGPALEHYCCHQCHIIETNSERISDTVEFFPPNTTQEAAVVAAEALVQALKQSKPPKNLAELLDPTKTALQQLQRIIHPVEPIEARAAELLRVRTPPRVETITAVPTDEPIAKRTRNANTQLEPVNFYANAVAHPITGRPMEYRQLISDPTTRDAWQISAANEFGQLAQGVGGRVKGTNTIHFILHHEMPTDRKATYP